ncbi:serine/threonine protein kinase [Streptomyces tateyamensis]|uniref:non-specific serine/threonine protein kinase n=1 Tax=Streptomyces tateyamensis TaxID=565073 RepID=A0A2V4N1N9_9ACTN|nr:serine/threonine-protein kinase [Streptomyces tateyamensis]PYC77704.1 serine/threonine protein kinase [Streptomyces tateyamensis]
MNGLTEDGAAPAETPWTLPGYDHERELGSGGSGRVVLATHRATGTRVAVKYLSEAVQDRTRLRDEAELLGALHSPQVAELYEYVEGPQGAALVMELVDGVSLRTLLREEGATGPEAALVVLKGSLLGLAAAHRAGVVHRDYKPDNVLVTVDGSSKLVDFGIAVRSGESAKVAGTPVYMAPEQWAGEPATPSSDVYAATATFFECLTGAKPYNGTTLMELALQHTEAPIPDEQAPETVRPLIRAGLAKAPEQRPESAEDLVEQLERVARAGYGPDWEERGRAALAALFALVPLLLLPSGGEPAAGGTSLATTVLGAGAATAGARRLVSRRAKLMAGAVGVVVLAGMARVAVADGTGSAGSTQVVGSAVQASSSVSADGIAPAATPSALVSASASASASVSVSASASATAAASPGAPTPHATTAGPTPTAPGGTTGAPTSAPTTAGGSTPTSPSTSPAAAPLRVLTVLASGYTCNNLYGAATVGVTTDGAADGMLTVSWITSNGGVRTVVQNQTFTLTKGTTKFSFPVHYSFTSGSVGYGIQVSTSPAAVRGQGGYQEISTVVCNPPR